MKTNKTPKSIDRRMMTVYPFSVLYDDVLSRSDELLTVQQQHAYNYSSFCNILEYYAAQKSIRTTLEADRSNKFWMCMETAFYWEWGIDNAIDALGKYYESIGDLEYFVCMIEDFV